MKSPLSSWPTRSALALLLLVSGIYLLSAPGNRWLAHAFPGVQDKLDEALFLAAKDGDASRVKRLVERGAHTHWTDENGQTVLHIVARSNVRRSERLLEALEGEKLDWNHLDKAGETPFALLTERRLSSWILPFDQRCQEVLEQGADANANFGGFDKAPILVVAAGEPVPQVTRLLLQHGAKINARTAEGETALHWALENYDAQPCEDDGEQSCENQRSKAQQTIEILLAAGANPLLPSAKKVTPLQIASQRSATRFLLPLLQRYAVRFRQN